jgi:hypothetical protein
MPETLEIKMFMKGGWHSEINVASVDVIAPPRFDQMIRFCMFFCVS